MNKKERPLLRYHGGKFRLRNWIAGHFPRHRIYTEAYGGAGSVLLGKERCYAEVYNDLDGEIVNLFRVVQGLETAEELKRLLKVTPYARDEFELSYVASEDPVEQARRTVIRSFMGFGSTLTSKQRTGFRSNSDRSGTTPAHDWVNYPPTLEPIINRLQGVVIENRPAIEVILNHDSPDTLHYVDPPYVPETRNKQWSTQAYSHEMADDDHRELAEVLQQVEGMVVISGYHSELYNKELFPDWERIEKETHADGAKDRVEVLWFNATAREYENCYPLFEAIGA